MIARDIIVVGASAGGVEALVALVDALPVALPAAVFVVVHVPAGYPSQLPSILTRRGRMRAIHAVDGLPMTPGRIYVAPPDQHLILEGGVMRLTREPKENRVRPAIDGLFRTAAQVYGPRVVGVVLSGTLYDGSAGLIAIKRCGGVAIVQDPKDASFSAMPLSAISHDDPDFILPVSAIAARLVKLAQGDNTGVRAEGQEA